MASHSDGQNVLPVRLWVRWGLLATAIVLVAVFYIGWRLTPYDENGRALRMETHTQLGLPPCKFVTLFGKPCPSCGLTTSFSLLMHGDFGGSMRANWVGTLMAICWLLLIPWSLLTAFWGRYWGIRSLEKTSYGVVAFFTVLLLIRWIVVLVQITLNR